MLLVDCSFNHPYMKAAFRVMKYNWTHPVHWRLSLYLAFHTHAIMKPAPRVSIIALDMLLVDCSFNHIPYMETACRMT
jgi:hypothetical protein